MIYRDAWRVRADHPLHGVLMIAVANIEIVVDVVVGDREIARSIFDAVVAEMVDLVSREGKLLADSAAPCRVFSMCDPVIEMQVVYGTPFAPSPAEPTANKPSRPPRDPLSLGPAIRAVGCAEMHVF